jgi:hypothetical protein
MPEIPDDTHIEKQPLWMIPLAIGAWLIAILVGWRVYVWFSWMLEAAGLSS